MQGEYFTIFHFPFELYNYKSKLYIIGMDINCLITFDNNNIVHEQIAWDRPIRDSGHEQEGGKGLSAVSGSQMHLHVGRIPMISF